MYLGDWAAKVPQRTALMIDDGEGVMSYRQLDERSNQVAHALGELGLGVADGIAIMLENSAEYIELWWGGMRSGAYITPINWHLTPSEVKYLLADSAAKVLFFHGSLTDVVRTALDGLPGIVAVAVGDSELPGVISYEELIGRQPTARIDHEVAGGIMFYSSGTTGKPKGIRPPLSGGAPNGPDWNRSNSPTE